MGCACYSCVREDVRLNPMPEAGGMFGDPRLCRMFLCEMCGNKRCPHAADHRNACTNSNTPGQRGSLYADVQWPPASVDRSPEGGDHEDGRHAKHESAVAKPDAQGSAHD